jgi:pimeloyl-ACP methyl ester carboxylesterase
LIVRLTRELVAGRFAIVAHSLGGHAAASALPALPMLAGLLLISAPPVNAPSLPGAFLPDPTEGAMFGGALTEVQVERFARSLLGDNTVEPSIAESMRWGIRRADPAFRPALLASIMRGELEDERRNVEATQVVTSLVYGRKDPFLRAEYFESISLGSPFREGLKAFAESGHSPHLDATEAFILHLAQFLEEGVKW